MIEYLVEENRVLRAQIGRHRLRLTDDQRCRLAAKAKKLGRKVLEQVATIVTPETLLARHRKLIAKKYAAAPLDSRTGAASTAIANLVVRMAEENRCWGYCRIQGALSNLGHNVARTAIREFMAHYHLEGNHQGLDNRVLAPVEIIATGVVQKWERLGGLLNYYYRKAA